MRQYFNDDNDDDDDDDEELKNKWAHYSKQQHDQEDKGSLFNYLKSIHPLKIFCTEYTNRKEVSHFEHFGFTPSTLERSCLSSITGYYPVRKLDLQRAVSKLQFNLTRVNSIKV